MLLYGRTNGRADERRGSVLFGPHSFTRSAFPDSWGVFGARGRRLGIGDCWCRASHTTHKNYAVEMRVGLLITVATIAGQCNQSIRVNPCKSINQPINPIDEGTNGETNEWMMPLPAPASPATCSIAKSASHRTLPAVPAAANVWIANRRKHCGTQGVGYRCILNRARRHSSMGGSHVRWPCRFAATMGNGIAEMRQKSANLCSARPAIVALDSARRSALYSIPRHACTQHWQPHTNVGDGSGLGVIPPRMPGILCVGVRVRAGCRACRRRIIAMPPVILFRAYRRIYTARVPMPPGKFVPQQTTGRTDTHGENSDNRRKRHGEPKGPADKAQRMATYARTLRDGSAGNQNVLAASQSSREY